MDNISTRLKFIRKDYALSQVDFAKKLGVTNAHISKIEKGGTTPSEALIKLICKIFGVNELWLKNGIEPIYIVEFNIDDKMENAITIFNQLLNSENENIRCLAADMNVLFSKITNVEQFNDERKIAYLKNLINLFTIIEKYNATIKSSMKTGQFLISDIYEEHFISYKNELNNWVDNSKKSLHDYLFL